MNIGTAIKKIREEKYITQKSLSEKIGLSAHSLCQIEQNKTLPRKKKINEICKALDVNWNTIVLCMITNEGVEPHNRSIFNSTLSYMRSLITKNK